MGAIEQLVLDSGNMAYYPMMGNSYQLNDIAKDIISLLKEDKSKDFIIDVLFEKYDISKKELFIDVSDFLTKLKIYGLDK